MTRSSKALSYISAGVIFLMMLLVVCDVFLRYVFSAPIKGSYEMVSLLMTMAVFFSFAYAQKTKSLVYMTFFMRKLPRPLPMVVWALTNLLGFGVSLILTVASFQQTVVIRTMATTTASLYIPLYRSTLSWASRSRGSPSWCFMTPPKRSPRSLAKRSRRL
jgi:TRAP-type C4-dicarboxylate transport system permease small subunit